MRVAESSRVSVAGADEIWASFSRDSLCDLLTMYCKASGEWEGGEDSACSSLCMWNAHVKVMLMCTPINSSMVLVLRPHPPVGGGGGGGVAWERG